MSKKNKKWTMTMREFFGSVCVIFILFCVLLITFKYNDMSVKCENGEVFEVGETKYICKDLKR